LWQREWAAAVSTQAGGLCIQVPRRQCTLSSSIDTSGLHAYQIGASISVLGIKTINQ